MRRLVACIIIGLVAGCHVAHAQTSPAAETPTPTPKDVKLSGVFSPDRVKTDMEAAAKKAQNSGAAPSTRGHRYYFLWNLTPAEFEALGRHTLFLFSIWTQKPEALPVKRVYVRANGQDLPIYKVSSWRTPVDKSSLTAKMYGPNREDGFYLVPGNALLQKGEIVLDLANQGGWVMMGLPSNVAIRDARRFPNTSPGPNAKPDLRTLPAVVRRMFPGFPVPQSLP